MALGVGLIGCGGMGLGLARTIQERVAEAAVVVGYDPFEPARRRFSDELGAPAVDSLEALLKRDDVQAVLIATPNDLHCEQTLAAAAAGKHVFCEKPMALSVADCDRMIAACQQAGVKLMVGHSTRLAPLVRRLREMVSAGELGRPVFGAASYFFTGFKPRESGVWHVHTARSGGVLFHMGIHQIDLFHALLGPSRRVQYVGGRYGQQAQDFDDVSSILIEFASGATGTICVAAVSPVPVNEATFLFSGGYARLRDHATILEYGSAEAQLSRIGYRDVPGPEAIECELTSFVNWVLRDATPVLTAAEGRAAVAVAETARMAQDRDSHLLS